MFHERKILSVLLCSVIILTITKESEADEFWSSEEESTSTSRPTIRNYGWNLRDALRIYSDKFQGGSTRMINLSKCTATLPPPFFKNISSILSFRACANFYKEENCTGDFIVITPQMRMLQELSRWGDFDKNVSSIGPCYPPCHIDDKEIQPHNKSTSLTLYSHDHFKGHDDDLEIKDCTPIPKRLKRQIRSIKLHEDICIELHQFWDCTGKSFELRKGSPYFQDLQYLSYFFTDGAISHCGYNCTTRETENITEISNGPNHVRLYDMADYKGVYKDLHFGTGCLDISDDWEGQAMSIKTYGKCVTIFELNDCNQTLKFLDLNHTNREIHKNLTISDFDKLIRSIKLCDSKITEEKYENLDQMSNSKVHIIVYLGVTLLLIGLLGLVIVVLLFRKNDRKDLERRRNVNEVTVFPQAWGNSESDSTNLL